MRTKTNKGQDYAYRVQHLDSDGNVVTDKPLYATNPPKAHRNFRQQLWHDDVLTGDVLYLLGRDKSAEGWAVLETLAVEQGNDEEFFSDLEADEYDRQNLSAAA